MRYPACLLTILFLPAITPATEPPAQHWIWCNSAPARLRHAQFQKSFTTKGTVDHAALMGVADFCHLSVSLNGKPIAQVEDFSPRFEIDVTAHLRKGKNLITAEANSSAGPAAIALRLELHFQDGTRQTILTDKGWRVRRDASMPWKSASDLGVLDDEPWGDHPDTINITALDDYTQWKQALSSGKSADPSSFVVQPGFEIELLRSATKDEGSWVSLEFDPKGRLIIAREDKGLLRFTLNEKKKNDLKVETINSTLKECRGLLYAHNALYVNANESSGLYRLRDTNGDDQLDEVKLLRKTDGGRGHGRNDLALGLDGMIYAIHGDAVEIPTDVASLTSPLMKNSRKGRCGFVLRTDKDGKKWQVVTSGLRNPYGIDFNPEGEAFTYDADAEYDMGSPWYRPTRVHHLLPGGDYGWRAVTRSWPPYNPDRPEATPPGLNVGKGSPTAVKFGTHSRFPSPYQQALFVLDWAYGRIVAVHVRPRGASYSMRAETFLKGRPFNVTDLGFGPNGAMYVVTGGRKTQSGLYRIRYVGKADPSRKPTLQEQARLAWSKEARQIRRDLEKLLPHRNATAIKKAWPHLDSPDPAIRHAARIVIEHQPVEQWRERALNEKRPLAAVTSLLSLTQVGSDDDAKIIDRLATFPLTDMSVSQQRIALGIYDIILSRKSISDRIREKSLQQLNPLYPTTDFHVNQRLSELLARLHAPDFVPRTLQLLELATAQKEQLHYAFVLKDVREGWTPELQDRYFRWIPRMRRFIGGEGMPTFLARIEADALSGLSKTDRARIAPLLKSQAQKLEIPEVAKNRKVVRNWKSTDVAMLLKQFPANRNFEQGQKMFHAAACSACHRVRTTGNAIGPDLTSVGARFSRRDILESILNPDKVVAEQYRRDVVKTTRGQVLSGMILQQGDFRSPELQMIADPLKPGEVIKIPKQNVEAHEKSKRSIMPEGLLSTLTQEEILDLLAYLESGGNPKHPHFRR